MAKKSVVARNKKREKLALINFKQRMALKEKIRVGDMDEKYEAMEALNKQPRNRSSVRVCQRCHSCGRSKAVLQKFKLCRICLRQAAMWGYVPGLRKASW